MKKVLIVLFVIVLILLPLALGKGSSSYSQDPSKSSKECDSWGKLSQRIECRLVKEVGTAIPEACAGLTIESQCKAFYISSGPCYDVPNTEKDSCFRVKSGYSKKQTDLEKRFYVATLLYELQEYIEDDYDNGKLSAKQAAPLITEIIEIKRVVLDSGDFSKVKLMVAEYKSKRGLK
jgi:hypothetical protein